MNCRKLQLVCCCQHFLLLPPTDVHRMYIQEYSYSKETGEFILEVENPVRHVPWCSVNPYPLPENKHKQMSQFPLYCNGPKPFEVTVKAGLVCGSIMFDRLHTKQDSPLQSIIGTICSLTSNMHTSTSCNHLKHPKNNYVTINQRHMFLNIVLKIPS